MLTLLASWVPRASPDAGADPGALDAMGNSPAVYGAENRAVVAVLLGEEAAGSTSDGGVGGSGGRSAGVVPETALAGQLEAMAAMGFDDAEANLAALQAAGGDVGEAIGFLTGEAGW